MSFTDPETLLDRCETALRQLRQRDSPSEPFVDEQYIRDRKLQQELAAAELEASASILRVWARMGRL